MRTVAYATLVGLALALASFYLLCVNYLGANERGLAYDVFSGELFLQEQPGIQVTPPWIFTTRIDLEPNKVCVTSTAHARFNCRLVQFIPEEYRAFLEVEGWRWYWWSNRISFNWGYDDEYRGFRDVLRGYALSGQDYPFIRVLEEFEEGA